MSTVAVAAGVGMPADADPEGSAHVGGRADAEEHGSSGGRLSRLFALAPKVDVDGPRVRLGLAWAAVTTLLLLALPAALALVGAVAALAAAGQAARTWRRRETRPWRPVAVIGAFVLPIAALAGLAGVATAAVGVVAAAVVGERMLAQGDARLSAAIALASGTPVAGLLLVRQHAGLLAALVLLGTVHLWDASAFLVGSGAANRWEGHLAATATVAATSLLVAGVLVPPFRGLSPAVLGAAAAVTIPLGPYLATLLLGDRDRRVPALRRLDSLIVAVPVWGVLAVALVG